METGCWGNVRVETGTVNTTWRREERRKGGGARSHRSLSSSFFISFLLEKVQTLTTKVKKNEKKELKKKKRLRFTFTESQTGGAAGDENQSLPQFSWKRQGKKRKGSRFHGQTSRSIREEDRVENKQTKYLYMFMSQVAVQLRPPTSASPAAGNRKWGSSWLPTRAKSFKLIAKT